MGKPNALIENPRLLYWRCSNFIARLFKREPWPALYLNENIAVEVMYQLRQRGIEAFHTLGHGNQGKTDQFQLEYASRRGLISVTHNRKDFRQMHEKWHQAGKIHPGILLLGVAEPGKIVRRIEAFFESQYRDLPPGFCEVPPND